MMLRRGARGILAESTSLDEVIETDTSEVTVLHLIATEKLLGFTSLLTSGNHLLFFSWQLSERIQPMMKVIP
jgi:hypothetical protein